ncbi:hypothetical protein TrispH2_004488 [Trichoplax sp. H2]|nr:hypothetical protein TrispH2_004488 [Trichoplax sp. H2]|eukprot:RDD43345.1 hypothetical protein TrispH2_004488 [Trichoplax sp. H2]
MISDAKRRTRIAGYDRLEKELSLKYNLFRMTTTKLSMSLVAILLLAMVSIRPINCFEMSFSLLSNNVQETETISDKQPIEKRFFNELLLINMNRQFGGQLCDDALYLIKHALTSQVEMATSSLAITATMTTQVTSTPTATATASTPTTPTATGWNPWSAWIFDACSVPCGNGTNMGYRVRCPIGINIGELGTVIPVTDNPKCESEIRKNSFCIGKACPTAPGTASNGANRCFMYSTPLIILLSLLSMSYLHTMALCNTGYKIDQDLSGLNYYIERKLVNFSLHLTAVTQLKTSK